MTRARMKIEEEWVEIAAKEAFKSHWPKDDWNRFEPGDVVPELYLAIGRAVLSAVAPLIRAAALEEAAKEPAE